jgi:hypothetical protein
MKKIVRISSYENKAEKESGYNDLIVKADISSYNMIVLKRCNVLPNTTIAADNVGYAIRVNVTGCGLQDDFLDTVPLIECGVNYACPDIEGYSMKFDQPANGQFTIGLRTITGHQLKDVVSYGWYFELMFWKK